MGKPRGMALAPLVIVLPLTGLLSCVDDCGGGMVTAIPCRAEGAATVCRVLGGFGTYELEIKAPGFQSERRTATVRGDIGECGCLIVATQNLQVVLVPRT